MPWVIRSWPLFSKRFPNALVQRHNISRFWLSLRFLLPCFSSSWWNGWHSSVICIFFFVFDYVSSWEVFPCILLWLVGVSASVGWFLSADLKTHNHLLSSNVLPCIVSILIISETKIQHIVRLSVYVMALNNFFRIFHSFVFSLFFLRDFFSLINYPFSC